MLEVGDLVVDLKRRPKPGERWPRGSVVEIAGENIVVQFDGVRSVFKVRDIGRLIQKLLPPKTK